MKLFAKLAVAVLLAMPLTASACPMCREGVPEAGEGTEGDHDPARLARAYNYTIYGFLAMPPALMGGVGLLIYRSFRKAAAAQKELGQ
jgi:hypothetical protein